MENKFSKPYAEWTKDEVRLWNKYKRTPVETFSGHDCVDLGLPSGLRWATCNIGSDTPVERGDFFAWGETKTKKVFKWNNYKFIAQNHASEKHLARYTLPGEHYEKGCCWYNKYGEFIGDGLKKLKAEDDAAHVNWGKGWRIPSIKEVLELRRNCTIHPFEPLGGIFVEGVNGNCIFFPSSGINDLQDDGLSDGYWSADLTDHSSMAKDFGEFFQYITDEDETPSVWCGLRYCGQLIRPVHK